ncbi:MAG: class I SAM-dependent methyltransferase [Actinomycetota bacterium]|nr:class I SAM-dependent methyltransferase [Actinomycetota bacterium]
MDLDDLQRNWDEFGRRDPYWAIISRPDRRGNRWDLDEFLRTGVDEIDALLAWLRNLGVAVRAGRALDFGCGVGRLTQALARTFAECDGVDIAPSMIERAHELNRFGDRCRYHVNDRDDLALFGDGIFDLVYSVIVLQHIAPEFTAAYLREFTRVLTPGGVLVFQLPSHLVASDEPGQRFSSMADDPFRAEIVPAVAALEIEADSIAQVVVGVRNASTGPWTDDRFVNLGNHWRSASGALLRLDDGRASMGEALQPGDAIELTLEIQAPPDPGAYLLEFDLVIEGLAWFADRGSPTTTIPVQVVPRSEVPGRDETAIVPVMEIHGIPRADVEALLQRHGLEIVAVQETDKAAGWRDYWYVAVKRDDARRPRRRVRDLLRRR